jgi:NADPH:quinone reductase
MALTPVTPSQMTDTYRAAVCTALDGPAAIRIIAHERRALGHGEVRIAVRAAGVNFPDLLMTRGLYQFRPDPPFVGGIEVAGIISEMAADVSGFAIGDAVMAGLRGGGFAEEIIVEAAALATLPPSLSFAEGAAYRAAASTALHALVDRADLRKSEVVLVLGAGGGVGMAAVQLAKHLGAMVIAAASTPEKRAATQAAGADHSVDPAAPDFVETVKALTHGRGVDVVFDPVGGDLAVTATRTLGWGGRFLIVGFASGTIPTFPANHALIKGYSLIGLRAGEAARRDPTLGERNTATLARFAAAGVMRPHISHRFALDHTANALRVLEERNVIGRAVVLISPP